MWWGWVTAVLAILAAIASVGIGFVVWYSERKNNLRIPFFLLTIFVATWITTNVIFTTDIIEVRLGVALLSYAAAQLLAVQTLYFVWKLTKKKITTLNRVVLVFGYLVAPVVIIPGVVGISVSGGEVVTNTLGIALYGINVALYLIAASVYLLIARAKANRIMRHRVSLILGGVVASSIIGVLFNLVLPITGNYDFILLGPAGAFIFILTISYAIARYRLFDVRLAIVRGVAYLATFTTLAVLYVVIVLLIANSFNSSITGSMLTTFNAILVLVMASLLPIIKRFFDDVTKKIFFRDSYTSDEFYEIFNKSVSSSNDLRLILSQTSSTLASMLKAEQVIFFVTTSHGRHVTVGTEGHSMLAPKDMQALTGFLVREHPSAKVIHANELEDEVAIRKLLISYRAELVIPLVRGEDVMGVLLLGERRSGEYSHHDIRLLSTIIDGLLIAIQNALAIQVVKDLNANLEQRIDAATKELRASNAQLQRLDEAKDEFISMASHQLRTPLTSIKGYISMLMEGDVGKVSPEQKHLLREAFISSERMVRLIGDFLNVSRLQTGKFVLEKHPVDLALLVHRELESLEPNAAARGLQFSYVKPKNIPKLNLDENKIQQVIMNFSDNAIYYSKEASTIKVALKLTKGVVEFTVKDSGIGVPKAQQDQLFNKFFRATNARLQRPDGTGVGLFLAKKVIDAHHGKIIFESKEDKGSTFGFSLPIEKLRAD